jgi:hypothetical protein
MVKRRTYYQLFFIFIVALNIGLYAYLYQYMVRRQEDLSLAATQSCHSEQPGNIWLISYAEGELYLANQRALTVSAINKCVDFTLPYQRKHLDSNFIQKNEAIFSQKRGAGYWLWKPYFILETLQAIPENDILLYVDSGAMLTAPIDGLVNELRHKDIVLFKNFHSMAPFTKRRLLQIMKMDNEQTRQRTQLVATMILLKNTKTARQFVAEWLEWCQVPGAIDDSPSEHEYSDFVDHRHDQSILSLVGFRHAAWVHMLEFNQIERFFDMHRRHRLKRSLLRKKTKLFSSHAKAA